MQTHEEKEIFKSFKKAKLLTDKIYEIQHQLGINTFEFCFAVGMISASLKHASPEDWNDAQSFISDAEKNKELIKNGTK